MDLSTFLSALLAIIVIDLVLAGDNAIVIALAARGLPAHLQKRAILWGAVGAIGVRSLMTVLVVWLLKVPGLMLAGGAMLVWIGYRLLLPDEHGDDASHPAASTFWGAMRTIVIADAVMGLDNVLAVAGAAHGSYLLVVTGLVISVPIVVWGSTLVLKVVERYPAVVYLGAAVLVGTAVKMMTSEPLLAPVLEASPLIKPAVYLIIPLVLWTGFLKNHRRFESRIHARLAEFAKQRPVGASTASASPALSSSTTVTGDIAMLKVLVPVDGSANALKAVRHAVTEYQRHHELELHLLNVQRPLSCHVAQFVSSKDRESWHDERANEAMTEARRVLDAAGVPHEAHWVLGDRAMEICSAAQRLGAHHIVMGAARRHSLTRMFEDSVTDRVLETTPVPVEVVTGDAVSTWERWVKPAGVIGVAATLVAMAAD
jgi:YjbE family integral membrane protein